MRQGVFTRDRRVRLWRPGYFMHNYRGQACRSRTKWGPWLLDADGHRELDFVLVDGLAAFALKTYTQCTSDRIRSHFCREF